MKIFPVVHVGEPHLAAEQATLALTLNADGVYLINHGLDVENYDLFSAFNASDDLNPGAYIGVNLLGVRPLNVLVRLQRAVEAGDLKRYPDAIWCDDASKEDNPGETLDYRNGVPALRSVRYLGGVAFKYTKTYDEEPAVVAKLAQVYRPYVDVVTTSGAETGSAAPRDKLAAMHGATNYLALASGVSLENIHSYHGVVDEVLVSSSVETWPGSGVFNLPALRKLIDAAHERRAA
ncbi:hypothetical protein BH09PAT3_BH09PAT3_5010 [soil metagenome]